MPYCQHCGTPNEGAFCTGCGQPMAAPQGPTVEPTPRPTPQPEPAPIQQPPQPPERPSTYGQPAPPATGAYGQAQPGYGQQQPAYGQPQSAYGQPQFGYDQGYGQQPYMARADPSTKTATSYYVAIIAMVFALLGGLLGMILALLAGWMAKKDKEMGYAKADSAETLANIAFMVAVVVFLIVVTLTW